MYSKFLRFVEISYSDCSIKYGYEGDKRYWGFADVAWLSFHIINPGLEEYPIHTAELEFYGIGIVYDAKCSKDEDSVDVYIDGVLAEDDVSLYLEGSNGEIKCFFRVAGLDEG